MAPAFTIDAAVARTSLNFEGDELREEGERLDADVADEGDEGEVWMYADAMRVSGESDAGDKDGDCDLIPEAMGGTTAVELVTIVRFFLEIAPEVVDVDDDEGTGASMIVVEATIAGRADGILAGTVETSDAFEDELALRRLGDGGGELEGVSWGVGIADDDPASDAAFDEAARLNAEAISGSDKGGSAGVSSAMGEMSPRTAAPGVLTALMRWLRLELFALGAGVDCTAI